MVWLRSQVFTHPLKFLILLKTIVIYHVVKNLCTKSINGCFGHKSTEVINSKESKWDMKKEVSLLYEITPNPFLSLSITKALSSSFPFLHGYAWPLKLSSKPLINLNIKPSNSMRELLCANPPFLQSSYPLAYPTSPNPSYPYSSYPTSYQPPLSCHSPHNP